MSSKLGRSLGACPEERHGLIEDRDRLKKKIKKKPKLNKSSNKKETKISEALRMDFYKAESYAYQKYNYLYG